MLRIPFATGGNSEVRLLLSNDRASTRPVVHVASAEIFELGPTPYRWTRYPRALIRGVQRNLYGTVTMLTLILAGILFLVFGRRWRALVILLAVPVYYIAAHSVIHTEYRYILAIHYFLFMTAATTVYLASPAIVGGVRRPFRFFTRGNTEHQSLSEPVSTLSGRDLADEDARDAKQRR